MENKSKEKNRIVLKRSTVVICFVATTLIITSVGLTVGLVGRPSPTNCDASPTSQPIVSSTTSGSTVADGPWTSPRLPATISPIHYSLFFNPHLEPDETGQYRFDGSSTTLFQVEETTNVVIMHSYRMNVDVLYVADAQNQQIIPKTSWFYVPNQYLVIELNEDLQKGQIYTLQTEFNGELSDSLAGFYRSSYTNSNGEKETIAVTQMWPTDARTVFPCFDEPALKATFEIGVFDTKNSTILSNMPIGFTLGVSNKTTVFKYTPKMSSYLVTIIISSFEFAQSSSQSGVVTRIYARPEQVRNGNADYARNITPIILDYYESYFGVSYPLPKLDQIAIPDFAFGGMENWGVVTYRETALLYDETINSITNKQRVAAVISHEIAHQTQWRSSIKCLTQGHNKQTCRLCLHTIHFAERQAGTKKKSKSLKWFGNLISPLWWDEFWLSEGFATFIEYIGQDKVEPTWRMMDQFILIDMHSAMSVDALTTSRPIIDKDVITPDDINALVDVISYSKSASIIRMISHFTGEDAFKEGLKKYLTDFSYGSVEHTSLFEYWEEASSTTPDSNIPPGGYVDSMNTWVLQMGYPVVSVKRDPSNPGSVIVNQDRFLLNGSADATKPESPYNYRWVIPFWCLRKGNQNKTLEWMERDKELIIDLPTESYLIGNYEVFGYYRVNYDSDIWIQIINQLNFNYSIINVKSRGQLIDDAFNLARAGLLSYNITLSTTEFLRKDFDYVSWQSALNVLAYFDQVLGRSLVYGVYSEYMLQLVQPVYDELSWDDEGSHTERLQRINAINVACAYGNESCIEEARTRFDRWMDNPDANQIPQNLREVVYCQTIANTGSREWMFVWEVYLEESDSQEKLKLQNSLTCTKELWIVQWLLDKSLDTTFIRSQDSPDVWKELCMNEQARDLTWDYIRQNWDAVVERYGTSSRFAQIIESCTERFSTEFELNELKSWKEECQDSLGASARAFDQAVEKTTSNIEWRKNYETDLYNWFSSAVIKFSF